MNFHKKNLFFLSFILFNTIHSNRFLDYKNFYFQDVIVGVNFVDTILVGWKQLEKTLSNNGGFDGLKTINLADIIYDFSIKTINNINFLVNIIHNSILSNLTISGIYFNNLNNTGKNLNQEFFYNSFFINNGFGCEIFSLYDPVLNENTYDIEDNKNHFYKQYIGSFILINILKKSSLETANEEEFTVLKQNLLLSPLVKIVKIILLNIFFKIGICWQIGKFQYNNGSHDKTDLLKFFPLHYLSLLLPFNLLKGSNSYQYTFKIHVYCSIDYKIFTFKSVYTFICLKFINGFLFLSVNLSYMKENIRDIQTYTYYQQYKNYLDEKQRKEERKKFAQFDTLVY